MSLPWFAFNVKAFITDTMRLSTEAKGAYLLLMLDYYEQGGPAPDDDEVLASITGLAIETWRRHRRVVAPLFQIEGGFWQHARCAQELLDSAERTTNKSKAGKAGAAARWQGDGSGKGKRTGSRMPAPLAAAQQTHSDRIATAEANFGSSVTAPSHSERSTDTPVPPTPPKMAEALATAMADASQTQCVGNADATHIDINTEVREGANAPSPVNVLSIGSLLHPNFTPESFVIARAIHDDGISAEELSSWLDDWKGRCLNDGTRLVDWHAAWDREYDRRVKLRAKARPKPRVAVSRKPKGERRLLPDDWRARPEDLDFARTEGFDPHRIEAHFRDVWTAGGYKHIDHDATFRNFIRSEKQRGNRHGQAQPQRRAPAPGSSILDAATRFEQHLDAATGRPPALDQQDGQAAVLGLPEE